MAVKALFSIRGYEPETDGTWRVRLDIWTSSQNATNVLNDTFFQANALASAVNANLHTFVEGYIQAEWDESFNPLLDSVRMLNPVSLV